MAKRGRAGASRTRPLLALAIAATILHAGTAFAAGVAISTGHLTGDTRIYGAQRTCTLTAVADSYVNKAAANTNSGTATTLLLNADGTTTERVFVRFDLTGCSPAIPSDALVQSAKVRLTVSVAALATRTYELRRATTAWGETTVTWNVQPSLAGSATASATVSLGTLIGTVVEWTATGDVQAIVTGSSSNLGWRVADTNEGIFLGTPLTLGSREAGTGRPQLVVTYLP